MSISDSRRWAFGVSDFTHRTARSPARLRLLATVENLEKRLAMSATRPHASHPDALGHHHRFEERHDRVPGEPGSQRRNPSSSASIARATASSTRAIHWSTRSPWSPPSFGQAQGNLDARPKRSARHRRRHHSSPSPWLRACRPTRRSLMSWSSPTPARPPRRPTHSRPRRSGRTPSAS